MLIGTIFQTNVVCGGFVRKSVFDRGRVDYWVCVGKPAFLDPTNPCCQVSLPPHPGPLSLSLRQCHIWWWLIAPCHQIWWCFGQRLSHSQINEPTDNCWCWPGSEALMCSVGLGIIFSSRHPLVQPSETTGKLETDWRGLEMGTLALDAQNVDSDIYLSLGLTELRKGDSGIPRVLSLLSSLLERSVQKNEILLEATQIKDVVTIFHGLRAPTLSIRQYIDRIFKYSGCSPSCFVVAHIYVDRFLQSTEVQLTSLNVHRLLITSLMLAAKFIDDAFFNNAYYAKVGGVSTSELNRLEMKFLFSIDFRLQVTIETFGRYCLQLEKETAEVLQIERPFKACGIKESWSNKDDSSCAPTVAQ